MHRIDYPDGLASRLVQAGQIPQDYWVGDIVDWLGEHYQARLYSDRYQDYLLTESKFDPVSGRQQFSIEFADSKQAMEFMLRYG